MPTPAASLSGPPSRFFSAPLLAYRRDPLGFMEAAVRDYGDFCRFRMAGRWFFFVNRPDLAEELLVRRAASFHKGLVLKRIRVLLGEGLLTSEGEFHLRQRRMIQPLFHRERVRRYGEVMGQRAAVHADRWKDGERLDLAREMSRLTLDIVGRTLFDVDVEKDTDEVSEALTTCLDMFGLLLLPFAEALMWLPLPAVNRFRRARARLYRVVGGMIADRRAAPSGREDLLSLLVTASDPQGGGGAMTDEQVRDEALTLFLAGHETTANALAWTLHLLSCHPEVDAQVGAEALALPPDRPAGPDDLARLPAARRAITEAMRLYPPAWAVGRLAVQDTEIGGVEVPRGSIVLASQWTMHRKADLFPDPLRFDPDRWVEGRMGRLPAHAYFPFGGGTRKCVGESFAWTEAVLVLAEVARRWRFDALPTPPVEPQPSITLRLKNGLPVVARPRRP